MKQLLTLAIIFATLSASAYDGVYHKQSQKTLFRTIKQNSFQPGEKLTYLGHYGFVDAATMTLEVQKTNKKVNGRSMVHVVGKGESKGTFDWFFKIRDRYESYIDAQGVFPWMFIRRVYEGGIEINQDYTFYQHKKKVNTGEANFAVPAHVQDMLSAFYYARTLDFTNAKEGQLFSINCFLDNELFELKLKFLGRETIKIREGKFKCLKFCPVIQEGRIWEDEEDLMVWISDDKNKIPVLAKTKILVGSIKLELTDYSGLRNPISKI